MKGKQLTTGVTLVNFNSKVQQETKDLVDALIKVNDLGIGSAREFLEAAVELFKKEYPDNMAKADQYLVLIGKGAK